MRLPAIEFRVTFRVNYTTRQRIKRIRRQTKSVDYTDFCSTGNRTVELGGHNLIPFAVKLYSVLQSNVSCRNNVAFTFHLRDSGIEVILKL